MGCGDSKGLTAKETPIKNKTSEQNLAKKEESKVGEKNSTKNNNIISTENNIKKEESRKVHENKEYRDKINLIYYANYRAYYPIFGDNFVKENKDNIDLLVNGKKNELADKCLLIKGENIITTVTKNKLTDLSCMFKNCQYLKDFSELKYLDVSQSNKFSEMFSGCVQLTDVNFLQNWNVSNSNSFRFMFYYCKSLKDIKGLENWDVSNSKGFYGMFYGCESLKDIKSLHN